GRVPEKIRDLSTKLHEDVVILHLKLSVYQELFGSRENAELLSNIAPAFFQLVAESVRNDMITGICRLSDPSRSLVGDNISLATLVGKCTETPRAEHLLTAFQSACGVIRLYRNQHLGHNDLHSIIKPHEDLLPGVGLAEIEEILRLAAEVLKAVHRRYAGTD